MGTSQSVPELVAAAQNKAKVSEERVLDILKHVDGKTASESQIEALREATSEIELAAVDIFSVFEARMQNHFKRGPFSRKLKTMLLKAEQNDLADQFYQYYLAINVLKHGKGASYRELFDIQNAIVILKPSEEADADNANASSALIDVIAPGFFDGLAATILKAYNFLENK